MGVLRVWDGDDWIEVKGAKGDPGDPGLVQGIDNSSTNVTLAVDGSGKMSASADIGLTAAQASALTNRVGDVEGVVEDVADNVSVVRAERYDIEDFGAVRGRGVSAIQRTANTNAINAAAAAAKGGVSPFHDSSLGTVVMKGEYEVDPGIELCCNVDAAQATLFVYGITSGQTAVLVGSITERVNDLTLFMPKVRKFPSGWNSETGVEFAGVSSSTIFLTGVAYFERNVLFSARDGSPASVSNRVYIGRLTDGKVQLELAPADTVGWVNENTFFGGHFQINQSYGTKVSGCVPIKMTGKAGGNTVNNNVFYHPNLEGIPYAYHLDVERGQFNDVYNGRWERGDGSPPQVRFHESRWNTLWSGYQFWNVEIINSGSWSSNYMMSQTSLVSGDRTTTGNYSGVGTLVGRYQLTDGRGQVIGYIPVYDSVT